MVESKHTPGPWVVTGRLGHGWHIAPNIAVAYGGDASGHGVDGEANANLIAAAPYLLAALKDVVAACGDPPHARRITVQPDGWIAKAKAAIWAAEGRADA